MSEESSTPRELTRLLVDWGNGDEAALERLMPLVYDELRRLARHYMRRERPGHTIQPTALVNEAYLRLVEQQNVPWQSRAHFFGIASRLMRQILVDYARARNYRKRGGGGQQVSLSEAAGAVGGRAAELLALDEALVSLAALDEQQARVVELRYFGGLTIEEAAEVLGVSHATVERDWRAARAWLRREMSQDKSSDE